MCPDALETRSVVMNTVQGYLFSFLKNGSGEAQVSRYGVFNVATTVGMGINLLSFLEARRRL